MEAFRFYDPVTHVTRDVPTGKTYALVRASEGSDPGAEINLAMGTETGLGQVWQRQFGRRIYVVLLAPKTS